MIYAEVLEITKISAKKSKNISFYTFTCNLD